MYDTLEIHERPLAVCVDTWFNQSTECTEGLLMMITQLLRAPGRVTLLEINITKNNLFIKIRINTAA